MREAMALGRVRGFHAVRRSSIEDREWLEYFAHLGWTPATVRDGHKDYTMPARFPSQLPPGWNPMAPAAKARAPPTDGLSWTKGANG
jgi:hypothetical protein